MNFIPTFKCPFCEKEIASSLDFSSEMITGVLQFCDCPQFRADWEAKHRAIMERRKIAKRSITKNNRRRSRG